MLRRSAGRAPADAEAGRSASGEQKFTGSVQLGLAWASRTRWRAPPRLDGEHRWPLRTGAARRRPRPRHPTTRVQKAEGERWLPPTRQPSDQARGRGLYRGRASCEDARDAHTARSPAAKRRQQRVRLPAIAVKGAAPAAAALPTEPTAISHASSQLLRRFLTFGRDIDENA
jgi:hypothetical protein